MTKPSPTAQSTLLTPGFRNRKSSVLRQRAEQIGYDIGSGLCRECDALLTDADVEAGACTQCDAALLEVNQVEEDEESEL